MPDQVNPESVVAPVTPPEGDMPLSELFPNPEEASLTTTTSDTHPQPGTPTSEPPATVQDDFFLKGSVSVYRDREAAIEGINQKDALIEQLRTQVREATGNDPLSRSTQTTQSARQPQTTTVQPTTTTPPAGQVNYAQDKKKFFQDMVAAANDPDKWTDTLAKFMFDNLGPYGEALNAVGQTRAQEKVQQGIGELPAIQNFSEFRNSDHYRGTLDKYPTLKGAIQTAENNPQMWNQLPEFYHMAHDLYTQSQLPQLLEAAKSAPRAPIQPTGRQPMTSSSQAPPTTVLTGSPDLSTSEGRLAYIEAFEKQQGLTGRSL